MPQTASPAAHTVGEYRREPLYTVDTRDLPPDVLVDAGTTDWRRLTWRGVGRPYRVERWAAEKRAFESGFETLRAGYIKAHNGLICRPR